MANLKRPLYYSKTKDVRILNIANDETTDMKQNFSWISLLYASVKSNQMTSSFIMSMSMGNLSIGSVLFIVYIRALDLLSLWKVYLEYLEYLLCNHNYNYSCQLFRPWKLVRYLSTSFTATSLISPLMSCDTIDWLSFRWCSLLPFHFCRDVDIQTGYRTKTLLCMPILLIHSSIHSYNTLLWNEDRMIFHVRSHFAVRKIYILTPIIPEKKIW